MSFGLTSRIRALWLNRPLFSILLIAALVRIVAAIFAKGYGMFDDHFDVIEVAQRWVNGHRDWLGQRESVRSLIYPGCHYVFFVGCESLGITDPQWKMMGVRFLHAAYSLLTVYFGYKTIRVRTDSDTARLGGLLLAIFWLFPFMAVRNLIEFVCIPPLLAGFYYLSRDTKRRTRSDLVWAGVLFGLGFVLRYATLPLAGTVGLVLLFRREWRAAAYYGGAFLLSVTLIQGVTDWIGYGFPFSSVVAYFSYNATHSTLYTTGPWYIYILLAIGVFIPPTSLWLLAGYLRTWRRQALLFWPVLVFLLIHSLFPNKQERFMLPVAPVILVLGVIGWRESERPAALAGPRQRLFRFLWVWFWIGNTLLLGLATLTYSKRARVETLTYLSKQPATRCILVDCPDASLPALPFFYLGKELPIFYLHPLQSVADLQAEIARARSPTPTHVIFIGNNNLVERSRRLQAWLPRLKREQTIPASLTDQWLYSLNPKHNVNPPIVVGTTGADL